MRALETDTRGSAAAQCGKAQPFRCKDYFDQREAAPRPGGIASSLQRKWPAGKAKPYRTVLRPSRSRLLFYSMAMLLFLSLTNLSSNVHSISQHSQEGSEMTTQERSRIRAPELTGHHGWLNTDKTLSLSALKGKVVLLDFWTYGCINCMHIIPDLKRLEKKYPNELVVIGVHSAKFENEKDTENIRRIILRYAIEHPIVNVADFRKRGELNEAPLKLVLEKAKVGDLPLAFPGKILADAKNDRLFIADSDHNRIVVSRL